MRTSQWVRRTGFTLCAMAVAGCGPLDEEESKPIAEPPAGHPGFASPQVQSLALSPTLPELYVTNTPADTLDIIDTDSREVIVRVPTGIDPVSVAVRPDGKEVWVANHVSDSVSIIDVDPDSATRYRIVGTVQSFKGNALVTDFDEPAGIAFASNDKAYVAITSRNRIAVVDVDRREVTSQIWIKAQDPRALTVRDGKLYVIPFESGNQTELSGCFMGPEQDPECTFDIAEELFGNSTDAIVTRNFPVNIIRNRRIPDRDLFVIDTDTDQVIEEVSSIGTMLYGVAVDSSGSVFVSLAEARNDANGEMVGGDDLEDLDNRAFLNQIARVDCGDMGCGEPALIELEPALPEQPADDQALATPFGIQVSDDDRTVVAVASGSSKLFTMDADSGEVLGRTSVGAIPKSLVLESDEDGVPARAWVFNAIEDSVSLVDLSDLSSPEEIAKIALEDPTLPEIKLGRIAFNDAAGSTSGTYSCESCHPDGNTDQLIWNLGAKCVTAGCDQKIPRTTMPIRGLRDTLPLHWDGVLGDPYGGTNGELIDSGTVVDPTCSDELDCFRDLVDASMLGTMCDFYGCPDNGEGLAGAFTVAERDAMAKFLMSVPYPPSRERRINDRLTDQAFDAFRGFLAVDQNAVGCSQAQGDCHTAPFWTGTNTINSGMDAPTFRGIYDRFLQTPNGRSGLWDVQRFGESGFSGWNTADGPDELYILEFAFNQSAATQSQSGGRGVENYWSLFQEWSTGFSGAFGRQLTLDAGSAGDDDTAEQLVHLERADREGLVDLRGNGADLGDGAELAYVFDDGYYTRYDAGGATSDRLTRQQLLSRAADGAVTLTLTARIGVNSNFNHPQPGLWLPPGRSVPGGAAQRPPVLEDGVIARLFARHVVEGTSVLIDGRRIDATIRCEEGSLPECERERIMIDVAQELPTGEYTLQLHTPGGLTSNEVIVIVP